MIRSVHVIGLGALGLLFGDIIAENIGSVEGGSIHFVMDPQRYQRHRQDRYTINKEEKTYPLQSSEDAERADLVIVAVKYNALESALDTMASSVDEHTIVLSVMNGITSEDIIARRYPQCRIIDCVAQGMDAMRFGTDLVYTKTGALHVGIRKRDDVRMQDALAQVEELFDRVSLPYIHEEDILYRMWFKFMLNVGINQSCMVYGVGYGKALEDQTAACMANISAMREVVVLSEKEGAKLTDEDVNKDVDAILEGRASTIIMGRKGMEETKDIQAVRYIAPIIPGGHIEGYYKVVKANLAHVENEMYPIRIKFEVADWQELEQPAKFGMARAAYRGYCKTSDEFFEHCKEQAVIDKI